MFPAEHFPGTPLWVQAAISEAIRKTSYSVAKWQVPLEAIGRYESNYNNGANLCVPVEQNAPLGTFQLARGMYQSARHDFPKMVPLIRIADPECSGIVAILYINSLLSGYGGYGGIGAIDGKLGLLPRTDRGPGNVLRAWVADPEGFDVEVIGRPLYRGY